MSRVILIASWSAAIVLAIAVGAQEVPLSAGVFSGTVTKVDPDKRGLLARDENGEYFFHWSEETRINGLALHEADPISGFLKENMMVVILFNASANTRVARLIEVKQADFKTMKGWEHPFGCGISVC